MANQILQRKAKEGVKVAARRKRNNISSLVKISFEVSFEQEKMPLRGPSFRRVVAALNILCYEGAPRSDHARNKAMFSLCSDKLQSQRGAKMSKEETKTEQIEMMVAKPDYSRISINSQQPMASAPSEPPPPKPKR